MKLWKKWTKLSPSKNWWQLWKGAPLFTLFSHFNRQLFSFRCNKNSTPSPSSFLPLSKFHSWTHYSPYHLSGFGINENSCCTLFFSYGESIYQLKVNRTPILLRAGAALPPLNFAVAADSAMVILLDGFPLCQFRETSCTSSSIKTQ